ncbi:hypothetical protein ADUPG1_000789, partial [Aduncisulcus paluster]
TKEQLSLIKDRVQQCEQKEEETAKAVENNKKYMSSNSDNSKEEFERLEGKLAIVGDRVTLVEKDGEIMSDRAKTIERKIAILEGKVAVGTKEREDIVSSTKRLGDLCSTNRSEIAHTKVSMRKLTENLTKKMTELSTAVSMQNKALEKKFISLLTEDPNFARLSEARFFALETRMKKEEDCRITSQLGLEKDMKSVVTAIRKKIV